MNRKRLKVGLVTFALATILWWIFPGKITPNGIDLASLGPPEACACAAALSPALREWEACSIRAIDKVGMLSAMQVESRFVYPEVPPSRVSKDFQRLVKDIAEPQCGKFDDAWAKAKYLEKKRRAAGYEDYVVVDAPAGIFASWDLETMRSISKDYYKHDGAE